MPDDGSARMPGGEGDADPPLSGILQALIRNGAGWFSAEVDAGRADARLILRSAFTSAACAAVGFIFLAAGIILLVHALALAASAYFGSPAIGYAVTGAASLVLATAAALFAARSLDIAPRLHSRPVKWLLRRQARRDQ